MGHFLSQFTLFSHMGNLAKMTILQVPVRIKEVEQESDQHPLWDTEDDQ